MSQKQILMDHGAGGRASAELVAQIFTNAFKNHILDEMEDAAVLEVPRGRIAISTDSFVVDPVVFPGGNIGSLAVHGTVNDIAMRGAQPLWLTAGFVLEEGLDMNLLTEIVEAMAAAALEAGVIIVAGDTKVVGRGQADKIFINTSGLGVIPEGIHVAAAQAASGDAVLISGTMGDHGATILAQREGLGLDSKLKSDSAALNGLVTELLAACPSIHTLRDPTRGGLATTLNEIAEASGSSIELDETAIPLNPAAKGLCEILGLDLLYLANEGKLICILPQDQAPTALEIMQGHELGQHAALVGRVLPGSPPRVWLNTSVGGRRILDMLSGEPLPRIC